MTTATKPIGSPFGVHPDLQQKIVDLNERLSRIPFSALGNPENHALLVERDRLSAIAEEIEANHEPYRVWDAFVALLYAARPSLSCDMLHMDKERLREAIETAEEILGR